MALIRIDMQGAFPPPSTQAEVDWLNDFRARCRLVKSRCVVINEDKDNEEYITNFKYHICHHDEGVNHPPCEEWQEI